MGNNHPQGDTLNASPEQSGFALASVLWFILVLALLAASVASLSNIEHVLVNREVENLRDRAAAEAGIAIALNGILESATSRSSPSNMIPKSLVYNGRTIAIDVRDESGKIDLNTAAPALLVSLFVTVGFDGDEASAFKDRILDWRDGNNLVHLNGAEEAEYRNAGLDIKPRNMPFETTEELSQVLGVDRTLLECFNSSLTVYSNKKVASSLHASELTRSALRIAQDNQDEVTPDSNTKVKQQNLAGRVFEISASTGNTRITEIVKITGRKEEPYWLLNTSLSSEPKNCPRNIATDSAS